MKATNAKAWSLRFSFLSFFMFAIAGATALSAGSPSTNTAASASCSAPEYRQFDFTSPWEGTAYELPGDEKAKGQ